MKQDIDLTPWDKYTSRVYEEGRWEWLALTPEGECIGRFSSQGQAAVAVRDYANP